MAVIDVGVARVMGGASDQFGVLVGAGSFRAARYRPA
jgi:hypothetical protein